MVQLVDSERGDRSIEHRGRASAPRFLAADFSSMVNSSSDTYRERHQSPGVAEHLDAGLHQVLNRLRRRRPGQ